MEKINKYGFIHWGCSFFTLDTKAHDFALDLIWDCMTSNASIYYHKPILPQDRDKLEFDVFSLSQTKSTIVVQGIISKDDEKMVSSIFTFVKIKK